MVDFSHQLVQYEFVRLRLLILPLLVLRLSSAQNLTTRSERATAIPPSSAPAGISLWNVSATAPGSALIYITCASAGNSFAAVQFDLRYPAQALEISSALGGVGSAAHKSLATSDPEPRQERKVGRPHGVLRLLIAGLNQTNIADGVIATLSVQVRAGTPPGYYPLLIGNVVASDSDANPAYLPGASGGITVLANGVTRPRVTSVANAASFVADAVAPGEIVVIRGTSLGAATVSTEQLTAAGLASTQLAGTRVLFDTIPAALLYSMQDQVSAVVPYLVDGHAQTSIQVEYQGVQSAPIILPLAKTAVGIFTVSQTGAGQTAAFNEDGTINGPDNPAAPGSVVSIYGTGEGQTVPPGIDGAIIGALNQDLPRAPIAASIGGQSASLILAGPAPGEVAGVLRVNVRLPDTAPVGPSIPVTITAGDSISQAGATIAVK